MVFDPDERAGLDAWVRRYCALTAGTEATQGRFAFCVGKANRNAKEARSPVAWGDPVATAQVVAETVENLLAEEEGNVYVRAYEYGSTNPRNVYTVHGSVSSFAGSADSAAAYDSDAPPAAILVRGMVDTNAMLARMVQDRDARIELHHRHQLQATETVTHLLVREGIADLALRQAAMQETIRQVGAAITPVVPLLVQSFMGAGAAPPEAEIGTLPPAEQVGAHVERIRAAVAALGPLVAQGVPPGAEGAIRNLRELVRAVGPALGLVVTEGGA